MTERPLSPAVNGTEKRLDAVIARLDRLCDLLTPAVPEPTPEPETIELREPAVAPMATDEPVMLASEPAERPSRRRRRR